MERSILIPPVVAVNFLLSSRTDEVWLFKAKSEIPHSVRMTKNRNMNRLTDKILGIDSLIAQTDDRIAALVVFGGAVHLDDGVMAIDYTAYAPLAKRRWPRSNRKRSSALHPALPPRASHRTAEARRVVGRSGRARRHRGPTFEAARWAIDCAQAARAGVEGTLS